MSDKRTYSFGGFLFPLFAAGKLVGVFALWSWWWVLAPIIPVFGEILIRLAR